LCIAPPSLLIKGDTLCAWDPYTPGVPPCTVKHPPGSILFVLIVALVVLVLVLPVELFNEFLVMALCAKKPRLEALPRWLTCCFGGTAGSQSGRRGRRPCAGGACVTDSWLGATTVPGMRTKQSAFGTAMQAQLTQREEENQAQRDRRGSQLLGRLAVAYETGTEGDVEWAAAERERATADLIARDKYGDFASPKEVRPPPQSRPASISLSIPHPSFTHRHVLVLTIASRLLLLLLFVDQEAHILLSDSAAFVKHNVPAASAALQTDEQAARDLATAYAIQHRLHVAPNGTFEPLTLRQRLMGFASGRHRLECKLAAARRETEDVIEAVQELNTADADARDATLMMFFVVENVSWLCRASLNNSLFKYSSLTPRLVNPIVWALAWAVVMFGYNGFLLYWILAWGIKNGGQTVNQWGTVYGVCMVQDIVMVECTKVFISFVLAVMVARPQLRNVRRVISETGLRLLQSGEAFTAGLRVTQHLSPACRAARLPTIADLPSAAILRSIDDADVALCRAARTSTTVGFLAFTLLALPAVLLVFGDIAADQIVAITLSTIWTFFIYANTLLFALGALFITIIWTILPCAVFINNAILANAKRRAALIRKTRLQDLVRPRLPQALRPSCGASAAAELRFQRGKAWAYTVLAAATTPASRRGLAKEAAREAARAWGAMNQLPTVDTARSDPFARGTGGTGGTGKPHRRPNPLKRVPEAITRMVPDYADPSGLRRAVRRAASALRRGGGPGAGGGGTVGGGRGSVAGGTVAGGETVASEFRRLGYAPVAFGSRPSSGSLVVRSVTHEGPGSARFVPGHARAAEEEEEEEEEDSESEASDWAIEREADWEEEEEEEEAIAAGWNYGAEPRLASNDPDLSARPALRFRAVVEVTADARVALQRMLLRHLSGAAAYDRGDLALDALGRVHPSEVYVTFADLLALLRWVWGTFHPGQRRLVGEERAEVVERLIAWWMTDAFPDAHTPLALQSRPPRPPDEGAGAGATVGGYLNSMMGLGQGLPATPGRGGAGGGTLGKSPSRVVPEPFYLGSRDGVPTVAYPLPSVDGRSVAGEPPAPVSTAADAKGGGGGGKGTTAAAAANGAGGGGRGVRLTYGGEVFYGGGSSSGKGTTATAAEAKEPSSGGGGGRCRRTRRRYCWTTTTSTAPPLAASSSPPPAPAPAPAPAPGAAAPRTRRTRRTRKATGRRGRLPLPRRRCPRPRPRGPTRSQRCWRRGRSPPSATTASRAGSPPWPQTSRGSGASAATCCWTTTATTTRRTA
jgi:hypothetical protein